MEDYAKVQKNKKYSMAFTTCSLLHQESIQLATLYLEQKDWKVTQEIATKTNLLQYRTESALKRTLSEIICRFKYLSEQDIKVLVRANFKEQVQILWFAVCLRFPFIYEFASEVILEKYRIRQLELTQFDYDVFFNEKLNWHEELEKITDSTRYKLKQVLFKMLKEVGIIDKNNFITPSLIGFDVKEIIEKYNKEYLKIFPN